MVKNQPAMRETWVLSLDWDDPLEEGVATHSGILAGRIPMDRGAWQTIVHEVTKNQKKCIVIFVQKNIYFCFIDYTKAFNCMDHNKLWKILKKMGIPDHLTCLLRNLSAGQEATVRTGHGPTDWFQIGKGVPQGCIFSPCLFNLYAEYIMRNAGLEEAQAGIKIARRNISNLRYADDTTLNDRK